MILSMTGFGRCEFEFGNKKICVDVKSLNSKQLDIFTKLPPNYKEKEIEIRKILSKKLFRGKIDMLIYLEYSDEYLTKYISENAFNNYYDQIRSVAEKKEIPLGNEIISAILRLPEVMQSDKETLTDEEWNAVHQGIENAIDQCIEHRQVEGSVTQKDIEEKIREITQLLENISKHEEERIESIKKRIKENLNAFIAENEQDKNRYEQEIIYYLEKLDINEEKSRLKKHCDFFIETMDKDENSGKKLSFIAQEIGREINTLGSKANHAEMQKMVILMKDELEKIKEQLYNIL